MSSLNINPALASNTSGTHISRTRLWVSREGQPLLQHYHDGLIYEAALLELWGIGGGTGLRYDVDDFPERKVYWPYREDEGYGTGFATCNVLLGQFFGTFELFQDRKFNRGAGRQCLFGLGEFYRTIDPKLIDSSNPQPPEWWARMTRPIVAAATGELKWLAPDLQIKDEERIGPRSFKPGDYTGAISMVPGVGNYPAIVRVDALPNGQKGMHLKPFLLQKFFADGKLIPTGVEKEDRVEKAGFVVRRGKRPDKELQNGLPTYFVEVQAVNQKLLQECPRHGSDVKSLLREWMRADSYDGEHWFNLRLTRVREQELATNIVTSVEDAQDIAAPERPKRTKPTPPPGGNANENSGNSESNTPPNPDANPTDGSQPPVLEGAGAGAAVAT